MKKDLKYYMKLPYKIKISKELNTDVNKYIYYASIPILGNHACYGEGRTEKEALRSLNQVKKDIILLYLRNETKIPEPIKNRRK